MVWQVTSITSNQANIYNPIPAGQYGIFSVSFKCTVPNKTYDQYIGLIVAKRGDIYVGAVIRRQSDGKNRFIIYMGSWGVDGNPGVDLGFDLFDGATYTITVETAPTRINGKIYREGVYVNGYTVPYTQFKYYTPPTPDEFVIGFGSWSGVAKNITCEVYDLSFKPSISYADDFSTDTVSRTVFAGMYNKNLNVYSPAPSSTQTNAMQYLSSDSTFWQLVPGENIVTFSTSSGSVEVANEYVSRYTGV